MLLGRAGLAAPATPDTPKKAGKRPRMAGAGVGKGRGGGPVFTFIYHSIYTCYSLTQLVVACRAPRQAAFAMRPLPAPANKGAVARGARQYLAGLADRYFLTISATLKTMASSNSRRSSPVNFLIFSKR